VIKIIIAVLSLLNGGFMLADGIHVLLKGKYIGPPKPGPWAMLFEKLHINVFRLGPLFIAFGLVWLVFFFSFLTKQSWTYSLGIVVAFLTLWYLPVGTLISLIVLVLLLTMRTKLGL
jgi:hypothetical protein